MSWFLPADPREPGFWVEGSGAVNGPVDLPSPGAEPYRSTKGGAPPVSLREALFRGLAPDGGLYLPSRLPILDQNELAVCRVMEWPSLAATLAVRLLSPEVDSASCARISREALDFPIPLIRLTDRIRALELFRGPTLAFKDVGARFMARLMTHFRGEGAPTLNVLTATSGDTGGAVAHAFLGLEGIRVVVLFPEGKVSARQESQFSRLGRNVEAVAVRGDFDDCQRLVKEAFGNVGLREQVPLTSANSINVGRLLPQIFYYFHAWAMAEREGREGEDLLFSVPSGNFGNLAAGLMAMRMGLPDARFLAATNANDVVPEYLVSGVFRPRPSIPTLSTAMDVGDPSNLSRILHLYGNELAALRRDLKGRRVSDRETRACIRRVYRDSGYVLDPHSAVGFQALEAELVGTPELSGILLATAHPAKFAEVVEPIIGEEIPLPPSLAAALEGDRRVTPMEPDPARLVSFLKGL